jgi:hypothetical protein
VFKKNANSYSYNKINNKTSIKNSAQSVKQALNKLDPVSDYNALRSSVNTTSAKY